MESLIVRPSVYTSSVLCFCRREEFVLAVVCLLQFFTDLVTITGRNQLYQVVKTNDGPIGQVAVQLARMVRIRPIGADADCRGTVVGSA